MHHTLTEDLHRGHQWFTKGPTYRNTTVRLKEALGKLLAAYRDQPMLPLPQDDAELADVRAFFSKVEASFAGQGWPYP